MRLILALLFLLTLAGCRESAQPTPTPDAASARIALRIDPDPPTVGEAALIITLTDAADQPIDGASVSVRGDMDHAGMQPVFGDAADSRDGVYRVPFVWTMGGGWIVTVSAALPDGTTVSQEFDLSVQS
jgi:hypothetical protein